MKAIRISEVFYSLQGEGKRIGTPSVFVRSFGCNLRCPGFGICTEWVDKKMINIEVNTISKGHHSVPYKKIQDMPLAKTGCDSYPSIYPEFKDLSPKLAVDILIEKILDATPYHSMRNIDLVLTGGEPLMWQSYWQQVIEGLINDHELFNVTIETNGTIALTDKFGVFISHLKDVLLFSISPKMACSGNLKSESHKPEVIKSIAKYPMYFKFVVKDWNDVYESEAFIKTLEHKSYDIYLMPLGGTYNDEFKLIRKRVADMCLMRGYKFSDRQHISLWGNKWST